MCCHVSIRSLLCSSYDGLNRRETLKKIFSCLSSCSSQRCISNSPSHWQPSSSIFSEMIIPAAAPSSPSKVCLRVGHSSELQGSSAGLMGSGTRFLCCFLVSNNLLSLPFSLVMVNREKGPSVPTALWYGCYFLIFQFSHTLDRCLWWILPLKKILQFS